MTGEPPLTLNFITGKISPLNDWIFVGHFTSTTLQ